MIREAHLQVFDLELTTRSPLCVGSGRVYQKMEYVYDRRSRSVSFLDETAFVEMLMEKGLVDKYERFILDGAKNLYSFLRDVCKLTDREMKKIMRCTISGENLSEDLHLRQIIGFSRNAQNQAYVPGSSIKGALRTVILTDRILDDQTGNKNFVKNDIPESRYLNTLHCQLDKNGNISDNAVNSIMRGIQVSDSEIIPDSRMILTEKIDAFPNGGENILPIYRECVVPRTKIRCKLTLDQSILKNQITIESLLKSIERFDDYYWETYVRHFDPPVGEVEESYRNCLILGSGAGYFSKTVTYPYLGEKEALPHVADLMGHQFKAHHHERDTALGISPRTMKYAEYDRELYPYGVCEVSLS